MGEKRKIAIFVLAFLAFLFFYLGVYFDETDIFLNTPKITGKASSDTINLSINIGNFAPVWSDVSSEILVCEADKLVYPVNATDVGTDTLTLDINPSGGPIYLNEISEYSNGSGDTVVLGRLVSGTLSKSDVGVQEWRLDVTDDLTTASKYTNISVIEINNAPVITSISDQLAIVGTPFFLQINVSDIEDGTQADGNLSFNVSFSGDKLFNISSTANISFTPVSSQVGNQIVEVCATDFNLSNPSTNISFCGLGAANNKSACDSFILTISTSTGSSTSIGTSSSGGGGSGGGGSAIKEFCAVEWTCIDWEQCINLDDALVEGKIARKDYRSFLDICKTNEWSVENCGYQLRDCSDVNSCNKDINKPVVSRECFYTNNPNCNDKIKNCHDGACEFLVDCGGPCDACPTCNDEIINQGESGVDCGGPCSIQCEILTSPPRLFEELTFVDFVLIFTVIGTVVLVVWLYYFLSKRSTIQIKKGHKKK